jgi:ADP-ribosyl-[dinitrogen reductase] hydrolase
VRAACRVQSHVTHHNALSDAATEFVVLALQDLLLGATLAAVRERRIVPFIAAHPEFDYERKREENPSGFIVDTLRAVLQALLATDGFEACLVDVVNRGGDADTTGAIVGMLAGALYGKDALPARWLKVVEMDTRLKCSAQAQELIGLARRSRSGIIHASPRP